MELDVCIYYLVVFVYFVILFVVNILMSSKVLLMRPTESFRILGRAQLCTNG